MVKVRFAPSPTGFLHIGGARTALFNWMYAKAQGGQFVLRIEDTDLTRSEKRFEDEILDSMQWLGMDWDELYHQSERFDIYREQAQKLLGEEKAYKDGEAIILKMIPDQEIKIYDLIRGEITFNSSELKDQVLMKSDGSPAYSFCCVVDDALMGISCVVRGEDHISNTPKQIMIYRALDFKPPKFAHLPLIMGEDGSRLSKRTGAVAVSDYRKAGYLYEALVNYLMLLGWAPGNNQEIIEMKSALKKFSVKKINKAAAVFSMDKLNWMNNQYLKAYDTKDLIKLLIPLLERNAYINQEFDRQRLQNIVNLYKGRLTTLNDFVEWTDFLFTDKFTVDEEAVQKELDGTFTEELTAIAIAFEDIEKFDGKVAYETYKAVSKTKTFESGKLIHPLRVALTGKAVGPSLFEIIGLLGQEKTVERIKLAIDEKKD